MTTSYTAATSATLRFGRRGSLRCRRGRRLLDLAFALLLVVGAATAEKWYSPYLVKNEVKDDAFALNEEEGEEEENANGGEQQLPDLVVVAPAAHDDEDDVATRHGVEAAAPESSPEAAAALETPHDNRGIGADDDDDDATVVEEEGHNHADESDRVVDGADLLDDSWPTTPIEREEKYHRFPLDWFINDIADPKTDHESRELYRMLSTKSTASFYNCDTTLRNELAGRGTHFQLKGFCSRVYKTIDNTDTVYACMKHSCCMDQTTMTGITDGHNHCKKDRGENCRHNSECKSDFCALTSCQHCSTTQQPTCQCYGYTGEPSCPSGQYCARNMQGTYWSNNVCRAQKDFNGACSANHECKSGSCTSGTCTCSSASHCTGSHAGQACQGGVCCGANKRVQVTIVCTADDHGWGNDKNELEVHMGTSSSSNSRIYGNTKVNDKTCHYRNFGSKTFSSGQNLWVRVRDTRRRLRESDDEYEMRMNGEIAGEDDPDSVFFTNDDLKDGNVSGVVGRGLSAWGDVPDDGERGLCSGQNFENQHMQVLWQSGWYRSQCTEYKMRAGRTPHTGCHGGDYWGFELKVNPA